MNNFPLFFFFLFLQLLSVHINFALTNQVQLILADNKNSQPSKEHLEFYPASNAAQWKSRSIYQVLIDRFAISSSTLNNETALDECRNLGQYCGGGFKGLTQNLGFIESMGFNAIWISPVVENTEGGYHGYWAKNLFKINPLFGTALELKELIIECHKRNIWVMLDVVANHMGNTLHDFSQFHPFDQESHYHRYCIIRNYNNQKEVEYCRIGGAKDSLADLDTENHYVVEELSKWVKWIVSEFKFDGIRIDTVKHVRPDFWPHFTRSSGVFSIGEVLHGDPAYVGPYQNVMDSLLNFPLYYTIRDVFGFKQSMWNIEVRFEQNQQYFRDISLLGNFVDNHDLKRFLHEQRDVVLLRNALVFAMMSQGIPVIYQGTEFLFDGGDDPKNRESMWPHIHTKKPLLGDFFRRLNKLREIAGSSFFESSQRHVWTQDDLHLFMRGEVLVVVSNAGSNRSFTRKVKIPFKSRMVDIMNTKPHELVYGGSMDGGVWTADASIVNGLPRVYYPRDKLLRHWNDFFGTHSPDDAIDE